jgi:hypothetical protein
MEMSASAGVERKRALPTASASSPAAESPGSATAALLELEGEESM